MSVVLTTSQSHTDGSAPSTSRATTSLVQKMLAWPLYFSSWTIASFPFSSLRPIPAFVSTLASAYSASIHSEKTQNQDGTIDVDRAGSYLSTALRANDGVCRCSLNGIRSSASGYPLKIYDRKQTSDRMYAQVHKLSTLQSLRQHPRVG